MLQPMGCQGVGHDLLTEQQQKNSPDDTMMCVPWCANYKNSIEDFSGSPVVGSLPAYSGEMEPLATLVLHSCCSLLLLFFPF